MPKQITIVNRHYPPNPNITGENAWDLANYLITRHQVDVTIIHIGRTYPGGGAVRNPVGNILTIPAFYEGENKILRYLSGLLDGYRLIRTAVKKAKGPVIVMTSPPLLPMWAGKLFRNKRKWMLWSMDLFPEGFAATGEIKETNPLLQRALRDTYAHPPSALIALGPGQKQHIEQKYNLSLPGVILPCGVFAEMSQEQQLPSWKTASGKIYLGYAGNCGNPHNPRFIKEVIDQMDPVKFHLVLAVYGTRSQEVLEHAKGRRGITILKSIPRAELSHIDVHLVTLVPPWTHVAVPSKAVSSVCSGATIFFCGSRESDNWQLLSEAGWQIEDDGRMATAVREVLNEITSESLAARKKAAARIGQSLSEMVRSAYDTIAGWAEL